MALTKGTNSYCTLAEANAYLVDRLYSDAWSLATDSLKEQALITATRVLDNLNWIGTAISESQLLAFPRSGQYFDPRLGMTIALSDTNIPDRIIKATCELAYHLIQNEGILDDTGKLQSLKVDTISLDFIMPASKIPYSVKGQIKPLQPNNGSRVWFRSN